MEQLKDFLTNDVISKRFDNRFDLVNYAIAVAKEMIHAGRGPRVRTETENPALQVLEEIVAGKEKYEEKETAAKEELRLASLSFAGKEKEEGQQLHFESNSESAKVYTE